MKYANVDDVLSRVQNVVQFYDTPIQSINQRGIFDDTPLIVVVHWSEENGDIEAARLLLEAGADVNAQGERGDTALHRAASAGKVDMVRLLLSHNASTTIKNKDGRIALDLAKVRNQTEIIKLLAS